MRADRSGEAFELAPMSRLILVLTIGLLALPVALFAGTFVGAPFLAIPAALVAISYVWVWLRFRPSCFVIGPQGIEVRWPLKTRRTPVESISSARVIDRQELTSEIGWGIRIGAGGLWGGFGLLYTKRRGLVQMYISRTDRFVWIELTEGRPWLITPVRPEAFVRALSRSA